MVRPEPEPEDVEEWRELVDALVPVRHLLPACACTASSRREMWHFGGEAHRAYQTQLGFDRLRYRLLPYIYSLARTSHGGRDASCGRWSWTSAADPKARGIADQHMFGPAFLVSPVTRARRHPPSGVPAGRRRLVRLLDRRASRRQTIDGARAVRVDPGARARRPHPAHGPGAAVHEREAGRPADAVGLHRLDAAFELYEDDGVTYGYEKGAYAPIPHALRRGERHAHDRLAVRAHTPACRTRGPSAWCSSRSDHAVGHTAESAGARSARLRRPGGRRLPRARP